jgi:sirohydrochlorin cobaltochelatase
LGFQASYYLFSLLNIVLYYYGISNSLILDNLDSKLNNQVAILICGHGSRNKLAITEFQELTKLIQIRYPSIIVEYGFLEFAKPSLIDALDKLRDHSIKKVIAIPAMLFAAGHVKNDIPSLLMNYSSKTGIEIIYGRELGINNLMISAACERVKDVFKQNKTLKPEESLLVVVGRGSSDPDANSNVSKITRMIVEGLGLGWGETVFSGVTFPLVEPGLKNVVRLGYKNIIIFPYFLFSGVLVTRIKRQSDLVAINNPNISFIHAKYLSSQSYVVDTFVERIEEILNNEGKNFMNCSTCKYRSNLFGFEKEVGMIQESHHDHVEGLGISCDLCDLECNGACEIQSQIPAHKKEKSNLPEDGHLEHDHEHQEANQHEHNHQFHHHSIYPNSKHPLGPVTLRLPNEDQILRKSVENN